jgi:hypothetical protein
MRAGAYFSFISDDDALKYLSIRGEHLPFDQPFVSQ